MHGVDLGESFPTSIYLQNVASISKHFLKLATSASQPAISVNPVYLQISLNFNFQFSNFKFQIPKFPISQFPIVSQPSPILWFLWSLWSLTIPHDRKWSLPIPPIPPIPSIRPDTSDQCDLLHTHTLPISSFLSLRLLVNVRTSSTRGARLGTRAGTCTAENEPYYFVISSPPEF